MRADCAADCVLGACAQVTPVRPFERNGEILTVAILAQGTHWATAARQASCPGSIPASVFHASTLASFLQTCLQGARAQILLLPGLLAAGYWLARLACLLAARLPGLVG